MIESIENVREIKNWLNRPIKIYTETIFGHANHPYRWQLRIGRLAIHKFYRGDIDPDAHDHPAYFYTFPLQSYIEDVFDPIKNKWRTNFVKSFKIHFREATYCHRLVGRWAGSITSNGKPMSIISDKAFWTIVWWGPQQRVWGFHVRGIWVPWRDYLDPKQKLWIDK